MNQIAELLLVMVAGLWGFANAQFAGAKLVNEIRDNIILGRRGEQELTLEHRRHMAFRDWRPINVGIVFASFAMACVVIAAAILIASSPEIEGKGLVKFFVVVVSFMVAFVPLLATVGWCFSLFKDWQLIRQTITKAEKAADFSERKPV